MNKPQKPLMLAYIVFLIICIVFYPISEMLDLNFSRWGNIIVAATIASYAFTLSTMPKLILRLENTHLSYIKEDSNILKKIQNKVNESFNETESSNELIEEINSEIKTNDNDIEKCEKAIKRCTKISFWLDTIGFIIFFCILTFDLLYSRFAKSQEIYTLCAFIIIMIVEYFETTKVANYERKYKELISKKTELLEFLEYKSKNVI